MTLGSTLTLVHPRQVMRTMAAGLVSAHEGFDSPIGARSGVCHIIMPTTWSVLRLAEQKRGDADYFRSDGRSAHGVRTPPVSPTCLFLTLKNARGNPRFDIDWFAGREYHPGQAACG